MKLWASTTLVYFVIKSTAYALALRCLICQENENCTEHDCSSYPLSPNVGTEYVCTSEYYIAKNTTKRGCSGDIAMRNIIGGVGHCIEVDETTLQTRKNNQKTTSKGSGTGETPSAKEFDSGNDTGIIKACACGYDSCNSEKGDAVRPIKFFYPKGESGRYAKAKIHSRAGSNLNPHSFQCYTCKGECTGVSEECPPSPFGPTYEVKPVCLSKYESSGMAIKTCYLDIVVQSIIGGLDKCNKMDEKSFHTKLLGTEYLFSQSVNPAATRNRSLDEVMASYFARFSSEELERNITVCSCSTTLCNSDEADAKLMARSKGMNHEVSMNHLTLITITLEVLNGAALAL